MKSSTIILIHLLLALGAGQTSRAATFPSDRRAFGHGGRGHAGAARHAPAAHAQAQAQALAGRRPVVESSLNGDEGPSSRIAHLPNRRRHHQKARSLPSTTTAPISTANDLNKRDDACVYGAWQCVGLELQRCFDDSFQTLRTCPDGTVCSTDPAQTGCIWPFQADATVGSTNITATDEVVEATGGMQGAVGVDATASVSASASESTAASVVLEAAYANGGHTSSNADPTDATSSYTDTWWTASTSTSTSDSWDSASATTDTWWTAPTSASTSQDGNTASSSSTHTWWTTPTSTSSGASSSSKKKHHSTTTAGSGTSGSDTWVASYSSTDSSYASATSSGTVAIPVPTTGTSSSSGTGAPHWVIYSDNWLSDMPTTDAVGGFNRFILAFWITSGPADNAVFWESLSSADQIATVKAYNDVGVSIMVSAFGSTESPTTDGVDPTSCAQKLAAFVIDNNLNGVDIDYEDDTAFNDGQAEAWLITFQTELRNKLPSGEYLISHAPQAPWFDSSAYSGGGYLAIEAATVDSAPIDFYNIQFYNQGDIYITCEQLLTESGNDFPGTSIFEIAANGVALDKLVIGKPIDEAAAENGYMSPSDLSECVAQAQAQSWNAGVMYWEYDSTALSVMLTVSGGLVSGSVTSD